MIAMIDRAAAIYRLPDSTLDFESDLAGYLRYGYVVSTPDFFVMAREVNQKAPYDELVNPYSVHQSPNAWWVGLIAGDWRAALAMLPHKRQLIGWERRHGVRFYRLTSLIDRSAKLP
jgi:hypothetical protein